MASGHDDGTDSLSKCQGDVPSRLCPAAHLTVGRRKWAQSAAPLPCNGSPPAHRADGADPRLGVPLPPSVRVVARLASVQLSVSSFPPVRDIFGTSAVSGVIVRVT